MSKRDQNADITATLRAKGFKPAFAIVIPSENTIIKVCEDCSYEPGWTEHPGDREIFLDSETFNELTEGKHFPSGAMPIFSYPFNKTAPDLFGHKIIKLLYRIENNSPNISIAALIRDKKDYWVGYVASPPFSVWTLLTCVIPAI